MIIVGAGLCGLTLARTTKKNKILILEKSRGVGGRMATRRDELNTYDHGAQFYRHSDHDPFYWHQRWLEADAAAFWFKEADSSYYRGKPGMTALAKNLSQDLDIRFEQKVLMIKTIEDHVHLHCESGVEYQAEQVVLTCPLPQSLEILRNSKISYPAELDHIRYQKALVGLFEVSNPILDQPYKKFGQNIYSISYHPSTMVVVMTDQFSEAHYDSSDDQVLQKMVESFEKECSIQLQVVKFQIKRWRYSQPASMYNKKCLVLSECIGLAGDAFGGPSLKGAVRSALAVNDVF